MGTSTENLGVIRVQNKDAVFTPPFASKRQFRFSWSPVVFRAPAGDDERLQAELDAWDAASDEGWMALGLEM